MTISDVRPFWMTGDDPKWCKAHHSPEVELVDRECWSAPAEVPLSFMPGGMDSDGHAPEGLMLNLMRAWREAEAHIDVGWLQGSMESFKLTLDEAERLAFTLTQLVNTARDNTP